MKPTYLLLLLFLLAPGCRIPQKKSQYGTYAKIPPKTIQSGLIIPESIHRRAPDYPHINRILRRPPSITKRSLCCKGTGSCQNMTYDCKGIFEHGLPLRDNKEFIQPPLIAILNYIIKSSKGRLTIVEGHSCPQHHKYLNPKNSDFSSKHLIGAAVTFIPENLSEQKLIEIINRFYKISGDYHDLSEYLTFNRSGNSISNKEIRFTMNRNTEGVLTVELEVLFDKINDVVITVNEESIQNYLRY